MQQQLIIRENYGFTPLRRAAMPFTIGCIVLLMQVINGSDEGGFSPTFYYVLSGVFFLLSALAGSYRRENIIDKEQRIVLTHWSILYFIKYKETVPLEHVIGVELVIGYKRSQTQISSGRDINRTLRLKTNAEGLGGPKEENWHINLYSANNKEAVDNQAKRVCDFLDMELTTTDHRLGLDAKISDL